MNHFVEIPDELYRSLLTDWFDWKGLVRLDSAFCNKRNRAAFLALVTSCIFSSVQITDGSRYFASWLNLRSVRAFHFSLYFQNEFDVFDEWIGSFCSAWMHRTRDVLLSIDLGDWAERLMCHVQECSALRVFKLGCYLLNANFMALLAKNKHLEELRFEFCECSNVALEDVTDVMNSSKVTRLFIGFEDHCRLILMAWLAQLPKLRALHLCEVNDESDLVTIGKLCPEIVHLGWWGLMNLSQSEFVDIISQYRNLQSINIACAYYLTNESYAELARQHSHSIRAFNVNVFSGNAVEGLIYLLNACKSLHTLRVDASAAEYLHDILQSIGDHVQLTTLIINGECSHELLLTISQKQRNLKELCVQYSIGIEGVLMDIVLSNCVHIKKLYLATRRHYSLLSSVVEVCYYCPEFDVTAFPIV